MTCTVDDWTAKMDNRSDFIKRYCSFLKEERNIFPIFLIDFNFFTNSYTTACNSSKFLAIHVKDNIRGHAWFNIVHNEVKYDTEVSRFKILKQLSLSRLLPNVFPFLFQRPENNLKWRNTRYVSNISKISTISCNRSSLCTARCETDRWQGYKH